MTTFGDGGVTSAGRAVGRRGGRFGGVEAASGRATRRGGRLDAASSKEVEGLGSTTDRMSNSESIQRSSSNKNLVALT